MGLTTGLSATPFWWEFWPDEPVDPLKLVRAKKWQNFKHKMTNFNESILNSQLLYLSRFVSEIDFAGQKWDETEVSVEGCDAWAMQGEKLTFGWIVMHAQEQMSGREVTLSGLADGPYDIRFYRTWIGEYLKKQTAESRNGKMTMTVPTWYTRRGNPIYSDRDIAFRMTRKSP